MGTFNLYLIEFFLLNMLSVLNRTEKISMPWSAPAVCAGKWKMKASTLKNVGRYELEHKYCGGGADWI
jgi:hypothetical protein